jgi:DNA-binding GntR family transcriptional regulator
MLWNITVNDAGAAYDPLTLLRSRTTFGRPNWMAIYGGLKMSIEAGEYIPGSQSQLKARVGVSRVTSLVPFMLIALNRLISVGLIVSPK